MNEGDMFVIQVPGSTANLGPGFDSIGLALNLYLKLEVELSEKWEVEMLSEPLKTFPKDESNFVIRVALKTAERFGKTLRPCKIRMESEIPLARGLGSSAAAIVAGIELADVVGDLQLSKGEKLKIATEFEGHPDNVGASIYGGLVIGCQLENEVDAVHYDGLRLDLVAIIPKNELLTQDSRNVLPEQMSFRNAVKASAISNVLIGALLSGDFTLAGKMMSKDMYHQPYRKELVPHLSSMENLILEEGAFGVALSGAGPTVMCFCEKGKGEKLLEKVKSLNQGMDHLLLQVDQLGSQVHIINQLDKAVQPS